MILEAAAAASSDPLWWQQWLTPAGLESLAKTGGLVLLAWLFFTGRIVTAKMHEARVADLATHHARELAQKDAAYEAMVEADGRAYGEMKESRDYYRGARLEEKSRADRATEQLVESNEIARAATHALTALSEVAAEGAPR